ncbi:uncharacterized protein LOC111406995 [Olea europaea var. sylvestris]|uniref:uncharacterized protein LOC111406995 n=1 Tax=Olea europaea var. sylvestris TaxID=158386 RepID=UPI000C1D2881|nr:uncharacterized protein LOC111406995 [Olea europaea var. sylvestris]
MHCWRMSKKDHKTDWDGNDLNHINQDRSGQVESQSSRAKLVPRRANENSTNEMQQNSPINGYIFMPTTKLGVTSDAQSNNNDPFPTTVRQTENILLANMVDNFSS